MIGMLFLVIVLIIGASIASDIEAKLMKDRAMLVELKEKKCPPHKWKWVPIEKIDGEVTKERIVCELCGPLNLSNEDNRGL
jgi:hypothetical protein